MSAIRWALVTGLVSLGVHEPLALGPLQSPRGAFGIVDAKRDPVFLLAPGDEITFEPVPAERWDELDRRAAAGDPIAEIVPP